METQNVVSTFGSKELELAKRCLALISDIARRGAASQNRNHIWSALRQLTDVLERTWCETRRPRLFPTEIDDVEALRNDLELLDGLSMTMAKTDAWSEWNRARGL